MDYGFCCHLAHVLGSYVPIFSGEQPPPQSQSTCFWVQLTPPSVPGGPGKASQRIPFSQPRFKVGYSNSAGAVSVNLRAFIGPIEKDVDVCVGGAAAIILNSSENGAHTREGKA